MAETVSIDFKRGDDFRFDFTIQDLNSTDAENALAVLTQAQTDLETAQNADPQVPQDITDAEAAVTAAQTAYNDAIQVDITGWTITSQVRRSDRLIADMNSTIISALGGTFSIYKLYPETQDWPVGQLTCDIQFVKPSGVVSSDTFHINVIRDVTR